MDTFGINSAFLRFYESLKVSPEVLHGFPLENPPEALLKKISDSFINFSSIFLCNFGRVSDKLPEGISQSIPQ